MSEHLTVLQRHQARLAERRAEIRGRVFAAAAGAIVSDEQLGRWLDEAYGLPETKQPGAGDDDSDAEA